MDGNTNSGSGPPDPDLLWRRITERRRQLGMTEHAVAKQAGMSPHYLRQLAYADADFDPGGLLRVAAALRTTPQELFEGRADAPPGQAAAAPRSVLIRLSSVECWDEMGPHGVGRVVLPAEPAPSVIPVNYAIDAETVVYRTAPQGAADPGEDGSTVAFEVDRIDDRTSRGWSVLVTGRAERVEDAAEARRLGVEQPVKPWAGGDRPLWVRIRPDSVTGRRIGTL